MRLWLTILWFAFAWLFVAFVVALIVGPILRERSRQYPRVSEEWLERWHREDR